MLHKTNFAPIITPLDENESVCRDSVRRLLAHLEPYVAGVVPCLTSGEGWLLSGEQWRSMIAITTECIGPERVVAGIEKPSTDGILNHMAFIQELGIKTIMISSPFGSGVTQDEIYEHYRKIEKHSDLQVFIYNENALSGNVTELCTLLKIAELPNVIAIKDSPERERKPEEIMALREKGIKYYFGWEEDLFNGKPGDGNIVSLANIEPLLCHVAAHYNISDLSSVVAGCIKNYSLDDPEWFQRVKSVLFRRGIINTPKIVVLDSKLPTIID